MAQALQNNNVKKLMPIVQPDYTSKTSNTTNDHAQVYNINGTNNTHHDHLSQQPKKKNSNGKTNNITNNINLNVSTTKTTKNTNSNLTNAQNNWKYSLRLSPQTAYHRLRLFRATANHEVGQGTHTT